MGIITMRQAKVLGICVPPQDSLRKAPKLTFARQRPTVVSAARMWTMWLPGFHPAALNTLMGHWGKRSSRKKKDRQVIAAAVLAYGVPIATGKRRLSLHLVLEPRQRAADPDAYHKSLCDALVQAGALIDDNRQGVDIVPVTFSRGAAKASYITLENMA